MYMMYMIPSASLLYFHLGLFVFSIFVTGVIILTKSYHRHYGQSCWCSI